jgi:hypothetical protein
MEYLGQKQYRCAEFQILRGEPSQLLGAQIVLKTESELAAYQVTSEQTKALQERFPEHSLMRWAYVSIQEKDLKEFQQGLPSGPPAVADIRR